jgi:hypothetical protein
MDDMADTKILDDKVQKVVKAFNSSWNYTSSSWHKKWKDNDDLYNNKRVNVGYNGISDTFVPMAFSTVEAMVSATSGEKPVVEYMPTHPAQETNTAVLNGLYSYYWDIGGFTLKAVQSNRILFKLGTTVSFYYWDIDHPVWKNIPLRDFFCDPSATLNEYENAAYMGHRFLASKSAMMDEKIVNPDWKEGDDPKNQLIPKYKNLDKLGEGFEIGDDTDKQDKDTTMGSTLDKEASKDQLEIICYFTKDDMIYVANREQIVYEGTNPFKERQQFLGIENPTGMFPYTIDSLFADESQLYGKSIIDPIAKAQEMLNDLTNQNIDAVSWALDPVMELDPQYQDYIDKVKNVTGAVYPFKPGSYQAVQKPIVPGNMFNERTNIKNEIRETSAVDEIAKGVNAQGDQTATEIKAQAISSGRRFDLIVTQLESGGYYKQAKLIFQMIRLYVTQKTMYRVVGKDGVSWELYDPEMFRGDYEPRVKLKSRVEQEKNAKMRNLKEMYSAFLGSPIVKQVPLTKLVMGRAFDLNPEEVQSLVMSEQDLAQAAQGSQKNAKDKTPEQIALEGVAKAYINTAPDIKAELEQMAGLQPSATHDTAMTTHLTDNMAQQQQHLDTMHQSIAGPPPIDPTQPQGTPSAG